MKKKLVFSLVATLSSFAFGGIASWFAGTSVSGSALDNTFVNGTAYFLEVADGGPTIETMVATIKGSGLGTTNANVTQLGSATIIGADGVVAMDVQTFSPEIAANSSSYYCVLFLDADSSNFVFSQSQTTADWTGVGANNQYDITILEDTAATMWVANAVGGGDTPGVPEPTAFALLALGVAGLALRRKHA